MKRIFFLLLVPYILFSQDFNEFKSDNFLFFSTFDRDIIEPYIEYSESLNRELNKLLYLKNHDGFREVVILKDLNDYHEYLEVLEIPTRDDFVFLKFSDERSRVVLYLNDELNYSTLAHHLTLQYINFYVGESPEWFHIGLATYFEDYRIHEEFNQSYKWLTTLKKSSDLDTIYSKVINADMNNVKPYYSWILIDYLINSDIKEHNRLLWDSLSLLKHKYGGDRNKLLLDLFKKYNLNKNIKNYITGIKGYNDYMDLGIEEYQNENFISAIENFKESILLEPGNYSPEYYTGLCYSSMNSYTEAYSHFSSALDKGAPEDIVYYSIGINFYSNKEFVQAKKYLNKIEDKMYQVMVEKVLDEISKY